MAAAHNQNKEGRQHHEGHRRDLALALAPYRREDGVPVERQAFLAPTADLVEADRHERADQRKAEGEGNDPDRLPDHPERQEDRDPDDRVDAAEEQAECRHRPEVGPARGQRRIDVFGGDRADHRPPPATLLSVTVMLPPLAASAQSPRRQ